MTRTVATRKTLNLCRIVKSGRELVGAEGFEPSAFCSRSKRATRLRYAPTGLKTGDSISYPPPKMQVGHLRLFPTLSRRVRCDNTASVRKGCSLRSFCWSHRQGTAMLTRPAPFAFAQTVCGQQRHHQPCLTSKKSPRHPSESSLIPHCSAR